MQDQLEVEDILSAWLDTASRLTFTIKIAGRVSGGVFEDAIHKPGAYEVDIQLLVIHFECEEWLSVFHPANINLGSSALLVVRDASDPPGLSNITTAHGIDLLDHTEMAVANVGGIPNIECCAQHPLHYMTTWSLEHVLREYSIKTQILKDGKCTEVNALYDEETFPFNEFGLDEKLECAVTPGMPSFIHIEYHKPAVGTAGR